MSVLSSRTQRILEAPVLPLLAVMRTKFRVLKG